MDDNIPFAREYERAHADMLAEMELAAKYNREVDAFVRNHETLICVWCSKKFKPTDMDMYCSLGCALSANPDLE